eukprot:362968-Chlamydomonas_euryale.AAC.1
MHMQHAVHPCIHAHAACHASIHPTIHGWMGGPVHTCACACACLCRRMVVAAHGLHSCAVRRRLRTHDCARWLSHVHSTARTCARRRTPELADALRTHPWCGRGSARPMMASSSARHLVATTETFRDELKV